MTDTACPLELVKAGQCNWCGKKLKGRQSRWCSRTCARTATANHRWTQAKAEKKKGAAVWPCEECGEFTPDIEVNHIIPCRGKHGTWGCHHHQNNLQLVCKPCHKTITAEQRKNGWT